MTHVKEILFQTVSEYLNTTTIHGFAYVQKSRNVLERLSWCVIILGCISFSGLLIRQSLNEAEEHPIATTVELVPLTSVPFPAVTIDSDPNFNLWGFTQKLFNMLTFYEADNEEINDKSKQLKTDFSFVGKAMASDMWEKVKEELLKQNMSMIKDLIRNRIKNQRTLEMIESKAPILAATFEDKKLKWFENDVLVPFIQQTLLSTISYKMYQHVEYLEEQVEYFAAYVNVSSDTIELCQQKQPNGCEISLKIAYSALVAPFYINRYPFRTLGFGDYLSYFSRLLVKKNQALFQRMPTNMNEEERILLQKLTHLIGNMSNNQTNGISSYEIASLLSKTHSFGGPEHCPVEVAKGCHNSSSIKCCNRLQKFDRDLETVLKIMRYTLQTPTYYEDFKAFQDIYGDLSFLGYNNLTDVTSKGKSHLMETTKNSRIFLCKYEGMDGWNGWQNKEKNCNIFHRSFSSSGLGFTFNQADFWSYMQNNSYTQSFAKIMTPKGHNNIAKPEENQEDIYAQHAGSLHYLIRNGENGELVLVLQSNKYITPKMKDEIDEELSDFWFFGPKEKTSKESFKLKLHDPLSVANMNGALEVLTGTEVDVSITPLQVLTTNDLESLDEHQKKCRSHHEIGQSNMFELYRQDSCHLECRLIQVEQRCFCSPWQYPSIDVNLPICNGFDGCIDEVLSNATIEDQCYKNCPVDCTMMRYSKVSTAKPLDIERICTKKWKKESLEHMLQNALGGDDSDPSKFIRNYQQIAYGKDISDEDICMENLQRIAIVRLSIEDRLVQSIKRSRRVRITDHFSNIGKKYFIFMTKLSKAYSISGGTLGLFCGISIISVFEVLFWSCRLIQSRIQS